MFSNTDDLIKLLEGRVREGTTRTLSKWQHERIHFALTFTADALDHCGVPQHMWEKELRAVAQELIEEFDKGTQDYPNAQTELVWTKRSAAGWMYCSTAGAAGLRLVQDSSRSGAGLGKGHGSEDSTIHRLITPGN